MGAKDGDSLSVAEPLDGPIMQQYCSLARYRVLDEPLADFCTVMKGIRPYWVLEIDLFAVMGCRETGIWLSLGGFQEKGLDDKHLCNTHVVIDDAGKIKSTYKKIHL